MEKELEEWQKIPENCTSLLLYCRDHRVTAFQLGRFGIFQESHKTIKTSPSLKEDAPAIVEVRYKKHSDILEFIEMSGIKSARLFKTARYKSKIPVGFYYNTAKNLLGLFNGKKAVFRIVSNDTEIRDAFYEVAKKINEECSFDSSFDFDEYDYEFVLREFKDGNKKILVTYFYGPGYPNATGKAL